MADKLQHPARATYDANTEASQQAFLAAYPAAGNIAQAAKAIGIHPQTVYMFWNKDEKFREQLQVARELHVDYLEHLALQKIETMDPRHDNMHMQQLNAGRPEKYKPELRTQGATTPSVTQINIIMPPNAVLGGGKSDMVVDGKAKLVPEEEDAP